MQNFVFVHILQCIMVAHTLEIKIGMLFGSTASLNSSLLITSAAIERLWREQIIHRDVNFRFYSQMGCGIIDGPGAAYELYSKYKIDALFGPSCTQGMIPAGLLASYWNIAALGYKTSGVDLADKSLYRTLVRMISGQELAALAIKSLLLQHNWKKIALVQLSPLGTIASESFSCLLIANAIRSLSTKSTDGPYLVYDITLTNTTFDTVKYVMKDIQYKSRVIITCWRYKVAVNEYYNSRDFMLHAQTLNMTGPDYVYIHAMGLRNSLSDVLEPWESAIPDGLDSSAKKAFESVLLVESTLTERQRIVDADVVIKAQSGKSLSPAEVNSNGINLALMYDSMYAYGWALNRTYANGSYNHTGEAIYDKSKCLDFEGLSGRVQLNKLSDRVGSYAVWSLDYRKNLTVFGTLEPTEFCELEVNNYRFMQSRSHNWQTTDGKPPLDTPLCGFHNEYCQDKSSESYLWIIAFVGIIGVIIGAAVWRKRKQRYDNELYLMKWKIDPTDINFKVSSSDGQNFSHVDLNTSLRSFSVSTTNQSIRVASDSCRDNGDVCPAFYKGQMVSVSIYEQLRSTSLNFADLKLLKELKESRHENLNTFIGASFESKVFLLWDCCRQGSLEEILFSEVIQLDLVFKISLMKDLLKGLEHLHRLSIIHGNLTTDSCIINKRWTLKLSEFGLDSILNRLQKAGSIKPAQRSVNQQLHFAPEILCSSTVVNRPESSVSRNVGGNGNHFGAATKASDVYSVGMILYQIACRTYLYDSSDSEDILNDLKNICLTTVHRRPDLGAIPQAEPAFRNLSDILEACWAKEASARPGVSSVKNGIYNMTKKFSANIMDHVQHMMENYTTGLEKMVAERTKEVVAERERADKILYQILPRAIANDLKMGRSVVPKYFDSVSILFTDMVEFTKFCSTSSPLEVVGLLSALCIHIDDILTKFEVFKVETIGDSYFIASGLPEPNGTRHVTEIANLALSIIEFVARSFRIPHKPCERVQLRAGIHTGPVVAGVVGMAKPRYCVVGDTVNIASRMESNGLPMKIQISGTTHNQLLDIGDYSLEKRGLIDIKGKGKLETYWLNGRMTQSC